MARILKTSILIILVGINFCFGQEDALLNFNNKNKDNSPGKPIDVSTIQLIATPEKFDGKVIRVSGYLNLEFEGTALYSYKSDFENHNYKNSIWLYIPKKGRYDLHIQCSKKNASIIGTYRANQNGHFSMFSGSISDIRRIDILEY